MKLMFHGIGTENDVNIEGAELCQPLVQVGHGLCHVNRLWTWLLLSACTVKLVMLVVDSNTLCSTSDDLMNRTTLPLPFA